MSSFDLQLDGFDLQIDEPTRKPPRSAKTPDRVEAAARGAAQGATMGFADEIAGVTGAIAQGLAQNPWLYGEKAAPRDGRTFAESYRAERDQFRMDDDAARDEHPFVMGASEFAGALATAPLTGATNTLRKAAITGAKFGGAAGLGSSRADLTLGDVAGVAGDAAIGVGLGGVAGSAAYGITKGLGTGAKTVSRRVGGESARVSGAARDVAEEVAQSADEPSLIGRNETVRSATEKAQQLTKEWSDMLGEQFQLRPSQVTGDRAAALAESRLAQFPKTMQRAQAAESKQLEQGAKILDMYVDRIAADPAKLGRADVSERLGQAAKAHIKSLYSARSAAAGPAYEAFERAGGGIDAAPIIGTVKEILVENKLNPSKMTGQLRTMLDGLEKAGAGGGFSVREANNFRKLMGSVVRRESSILDGVDMDAQGAIARRVLRSIDDAFDAAEQSASSGEAVQLLRQANAIWRRGTEAIDEAATETVEKVLKVSATDAAETLPRKLLKMEQGQVSGVFRVLNQADPAGAQQLRAQLLDEVLVQAGKPSRAAPMAAEMGVAKLQPYSAMQAMQKVEPVLQAAYAGDTKAQFALRRTYQLLQRLSFGPNLKGAQTAPLAADATKEVLETAGDATIGRAGTATVKQALGLAERLTGSAEATAKAMSTPEGISAFNEALAAMLGVKQGRPITEKTARGVMAALTRAGLAVSSIGDEPIASTGAPGATASLE